MQFSCSSLRELLYNRHKIKYRFHRARAVKKGCYRILVCKAFIKAIEVIEV